MQFLTKSRYINGLKCSKWLWLAFNKPQELPEIDEQTRHRFDEGNKIGVFARTLFSKGIEINELDPLKNYERTKLALKERKPLFEAGFVHKNGKCYARADVLVPVDKDKWDIYEVKSGTSVDDDYIKDISFQKYCYESGGIKIRKCIILHINNQYIKEGKIDAKDFFVQAEVTEEVEEIYSDISKNLKKLFEIISLKDCPEIKIGEYCDDLLGVHKNDKFWQEHPYCDIFDLYRGGKRAIEYFNSGILQIKDLGEHHKLNDKQRIQYNVAKTKEHHYDKKELSSFIKELKYPLYYLDFESFSTAIPLYDGLKPYQQVPFQFSVHVIDKKGAKQRHYSFIADGIEDPRPKFLEELKNSLGTSGSIIVYNQSFEQTVLKNIVSRYPRYKEWADLVIRRMIDLLIPFKEFAYYHPQQKGSASIKYVLPVLTGVTYEDFEIANGAEASLSYLFMTHGNYDGKKATVEEMKKIREDLTKYCGQDTEGMIWILDKLGEIVDG